MPRVVTHFLLALLPACGAPAAAPAAAPSAAAAVGAVEAADAVAGSAAPKPAAVEAKREAPDVSGPIGVAVCDAYVSTYRRCVEDVIPAEDRAAHREVLAAQRLAWARARSDPSLAGGLADACAAAKVAARASLPRCRGW